MSNTTTTTRGEGWLRGDTAAAKYLGMSRSTFANLVRGDLAPSVVGGYRYWNKKALDAFMASRQTVQFTVRPQLAERNRARRTINSSQ